MEELRDQLGAAGAAFEMHHQAGVNDAQFLRLATIGDHMFRYIERQVVVCRSVGKALERQDGNGWRPGASACRSSSTIVEYLLCHGDRKGKSNNEGGVDRQLGIGNLE